MATEKNFWKSRIRKWTALDPADRLSEARNKLNLIHNEMT